MGAGLIGVQPRLLIDRRLGAPCWASHATGMTAFARRCTAPSRRGRLGPSGVDRGRCRSADRLPAGAGGGTRVRCARWRAPAATPGRAGCWCPRSTLARAGGTGGGWRTGWRAPAARAGPPGCKGAVLVRAPVAPGSAAALTGWSPRGCAAALMRRHADRAGGASLASSPAAACRKPGGARLLHVVSAFGAACL